MALAALTIAAGCGGGKSNPSPITSPVPNPNPWSLNGSSANLVANVGQMPSPVSLAAYQGISAQIQFGLVTSGSGTITVSDALNNGDVSPNTLPTDVNASTGYTGLLYIAFYNANATAINFGSSTPTIVVTDSAGFGTKTTCGLDIYSTVGNSANLTWNPSGAIGTITGNTVTIPSTTLSSGGTVQFNPASETITAISCR
jgi:hypothetical protein